MTLTLADGVTLVTLAGALIQSYEEEATQEVAESSQMVQGAAEITHLYPHSKRSKGTVKGKGALTLSCGTLTVYTTIGASTLISGGMVHVGSVKVSQELTKTAEWDFSYTHYPHAA